VKKVFYQPGDIRKTCCCVSSHGTLLQLSWDRKIALKIEATSHYDVRINRCCVRKREILDVVCTKEIIEDGTYVWSVTAAGFRAKIRYFAGVIFRGFSRVFI
jgi:hypothetical protein